MPTDKEVMQQALDALEYVVESVGGNAPVSYDVWFQRTQVPAEALRAQLAQPEPEELALLEEAMIEAWKPIPADEEQLKRIAKLVGQEPVAVVQIAEDYHAHVIWMEGVNPVDLDQKFLYTAPPKREFIGLTDEEIQKLQHQNWEERWLYVEFARAIEAKLKEKNGK